MDFFDRRIAIERIEDILRARKAARVFIQSDLFHENLSDEAIDRVFAVMALCPQHIFQVLTKRSARMRAYASDPSVVGRIKAAIETHGNSLGDDMEDFEFFGRLGWTSRLAPCKPDCEPPCRLVWTADGKSTVRARDFDGEARGGGTCHGQIRWDGPVAWPLPNIWLGVSCEDHARADERIPDLLATPAHVRFVSAEPLLGPIDFERLGTLDTIRSALPNVVEREERDKPTAGNGSICGMQIDGVGSSGSSLTYFQTPDHMGGFTATSPRLWPRLDWIIAGGESGPGARPMHPDWARSIRDQCAAAGTAFFFKQWGNWLDADELLTRIDAGDGFISRDGQRWTPPRPLNFSDAAFLATTLGHPFEHHSDGHTMLRLGKPRAGRLLDGIEHSAFPEAADG